MFSPCTKIIAAGFALLPCWKRKTKTLTKKQLEKDPRYKSEWSVATEGHCQWGGWTLEGRNQFYALKKSIGKARKEEHVRDVELSILQEIQGEGGILRKKAEKQKAAATDSQEFNPKFMDSDSEDSQATTLPDGSDVQVVAGEDSENEEESSKKRPAKRKKADDGESSEEDDEEEGEWPEWCSRQRQ